MKDKKWWKVCLGCDRVRAWYDYYPKTYGKPKFCKECISKMYGKKLKQYDFSSIIFPDSHTGKQIDKFIEDKDAGRPSKAPWN